MPDIPSNILKPVKFGGLDPTSVTTYIDELFSKMSELEKENEELRSGAGAQESQLVQEYREKLLRRKKLFKAVLHRSRLPMIKPSSLRLH